MSKVTPKHTCPHRRFWVGLIFEVSDSVFYQSRSNIDIGKTAQHMRNFSHKSNVTPLISDDCSDRPDEKWCEVEPWWTNDTRKLWFRLKYSKWFKMFHINLWKFPIFSLFQWNFSIYQLRLSKIRYLIISFFNLYYR